MRYYEYRLHAKLKDAYALHYLGHSNMLRFFYMRFFNEVSEVSIQEDLVLDEISSILTVKSERDELFRGTLNVNPYQLNRALAESYVGFTDRMNMFGLTRKQVFDNILYQGKTLDLKEEVEKCSILGDCQGSYPF